MSGYTKNTETTMKKDAVPNLSANQQPQNQTSQIANKTNSSRKELSIGSPEIEDEIQLERREAYVEIETQKLLRELLRNGSKEEIIPAYDPVEGYTYKLIQHVVDEETSNKNIVEFLDRLTRLDILKKSFYDSVSTCPNCESTNITLHNSCPKCKSHNITKTSLTEHIPCGYIGEREKYIQGNCPKCGLNISETPFADMGRWYICQECGEKFEHPLMEAVCRNCETMFAIEEANLKQVSKYSLNNQRKKEVRQNVASLDSISRLLTELHFEIQMPGLILGEKSGMRHQFSLLAKKEIAGKQRLIAIDQVVGENDVQASPLILYVYKTSEVAVDLPIFVAVPKLSDTAKQIAQGHQILIVEGSPEDTDNLARIKMEIENRLNQMQQASTTQSLTANQTTSPKQERSQPQPPPRIEQEEEVKVQLFSTTSNVHPEPKKTGSFMKYLKGTMKKDKEEDEE
jgi:hypothetical protein